MTIATQPATPATDTDECAVRDLLRQMYAAWGDADRYSSFFTPDADYVAFDGSHAKGRQAIIAMHRPLFERFLKNTCLYSASETIRFPTPDFAVIHGMGAVVSARRPQPSRGRLSIQTLVAVRQPAGWQFTAFQNPRYRPFAESLLGKFLAFVGVAPGGK